MVARLAERRGGGATGEAGADDDDRQLAAVGRVDELGLELAGVPALSAMGPGGSLGVLDRLALGVEPVDELSSRCVIDQFPLTIPKRMASGGRTKPDAVTRAMIVAGGPGAAARRAVAEPSPASGWRSRRRARGAGRGRHGEHVDEHDPPHLEAADDEQAGLSPTAVRADVELHDRELQQVPDEEEQQRDAAPAHHLALDRGLGGLLRVRSASCGAPLAPAPQVERRPTWATSARTSSDAEEPEEPAEGQDRREHRPQVAAHSRRTPRRRRRS